MCREETAKQAQKDCRADTEETNIGLGTGIYWAEAQEEQKRQTTNISQEPLVMS